MGEKVDWLCVLRRFVHEVYESEDRPGGFTFIVRFPGVISPLNGSTLAGWGPTLSDATRMALSQVLVVLPS